MTREEAIKILMDGELNPCVDEDREACDMAIKALKQEPCEDSISRQAVMNCFKKWQPYMATRLFGFEKELSSLPPVTPQPKIGHWQKISADKYSEHVAYYFRCSECGKDIIGEHNYCPNCGCRMEGSE